MHVTLLSGNDLPTLDDLCRYFTPRYADKWKEIGIHMNITSMLLEAIDHDNDGDINKCCNALWKNWLHVDLEAKWEKLFIAIDVLLPSGIRCMMIIIIISCK